MENLRYPAVPLITVDPYFNIWSCCDRLTDEAPRHWTGRRNAMTGLLRIDGVWRRFLGCVEADNMNTFQEPAPLTQTSVKVTPLFSKYEFTCPEISFTAEFFTPLLPDDLMLLSRPISYFSYEIRSNDGKAHDVEFYFDLSAEACVDHPAQSVRMQCGQNACFCGRGEQDILSRSGDDLRIEWGWLHLFSRDHTASLMNRSAKRNLFHRYHPSDLLWDAPESVSVREEWPCLTLRKQYRLSAQETISNFLCMGYDDLYSIEYFGKKIRGYWTKDGATFEEICRAAISDFPEIRNRCLAFDAELLSRASGYGDQYTDIVSLAYRQVIGAHKLTWDGESMQFFSKECYSNGCIGTVDVTYPSIPLFLIWQPDLICGMLDPIFRFAASDAWPYPYAPHDVGQYPLANGQVYGMSEADRKNGTVEKHQMPVEECGNMLLCVAAVCKAKQDVSYAEKHWEILQQWVEYLVKKGLDPENQLCTDDFAGHLAHNANLSAKAIMGIASWGMLCGMMGEAEKEESYLNLARNLASEWKEKAFDRNLRCFRLAFDRPGTWSIKYNLVWDKLFGLKIFDDEIFEAEVQNYRTRINPYGLPLDSRSDYTKSDWQMWSAVLCNDPGYMEKITGAMWNMLNTTPDRVPFTDWYYTSTPSMRGFQNRTVQGGLFLPMLKF